MQISDSIKDLYRRLIAIDAVVKLPAEGTPMIQVDAIIGKLAYLYEKIRNTMDFQEDHLLRRFALERNLKRRIIMESFKPKIALPLIEELIRDGYLQNNSIPVTTADQIATIINKYSYLVDLVHEELKNPTERRKILNWIASITACEIDLTFQPELKVDALIEALYKVVCDRIKLTGRDISNREKNIQLYITIHKELVRSDNSIISLHLLNLYFPEWAKADQKLVEFVASKITSIYHGIHQHLQSRIRSKIARSLKKHLVVFRILRELITIHSGDLVDLFGDPQFLESEARKVIEKQNKMIRKKLRRLSVRAILYIFITKVMLAFVLEYPYEYYLMGYINYLTLWINILVPPVLMFFVTLSVRMPGAMNTKQIIEQLRALVYGEPQTDILCELKIRARRGPIHFFFVYLLYILLYGFVFGLIIVGLEKLSFNPLSGGIFIFFVTAVSFFGVRVRATAEEYMVEQRREKIFNYVIMFFSLPIVRVGHWLSNNLKRINIFAFVFDFIIEAPFKLMVELIENWFTFLREKREETYKNT